MATLCPIFLFLSVVILLVNAQHLSSLDLVKNFQVNPPVTKTKVLNAFKRANPGLLPALSNGLFVSTMYQDNRAIIDVRTGTNPYYGFVEVYYNGGRPPTPAASPTSYGSGKLNLAQLTDLNRNLELRKNGVTVIDDAQGHETLKDAFMSKNPRLPFGLREKLKVKNMKRTSAVLYVYPSAAYEGDVYVTF